MAEIEAERSRARDGRHRRRDRSRAAIVETALALVREAGTLPSAQEIADRVGLTERTVFNLFEDKRALMLGVVARFRTEALARIPAVDRGCDLSERVDRFFDALASFMEDYSRVRWAALTSPAAVPGMERGVVLASLHARVFDLFAASGVDLQARPEIAAATRAAVDPMTWRLYRLQQKLGVDEARDAMKRSVLSFAEAAGR